MNRLKKDTIAGTIFVLITGTISHFIYDLSGKNPILGLFFPINESIWEHMKLLFFPMLFCALYMSRKLKPKYPCVTSALLSGIISGTLAIPVLFYTYSGILGQHTMVLDISTFIISVLLAFHVVYKFTCSCRMEKYQEQLRLLILFMTVCFFIFTYYPPNLPIFMP